MRLTPFFPWSTLIIVSLLVLTSRASAEVFEYHITTLTYPESSSALTVQNSIQPTQSPPEADPDTKTAVGPAEDMQSVLTSATNLIIARVAELKLGRRLTEEELDLSAQALADRLQLNQKESAEIKIMVDVLIGGWNGRRGEEGGWKDGKFINYLMCLLPLRFCSSRKRG